MAKHNKKKLRSFLFILFSISLCGLLFGSLWLTKIIVDDVTLIFGPSEESFSFYKKVLYSTKLYFSGEELLESQNNLKEDFYFEILPGESVGQISYRLSINNLIQNPEIFKDFLIYRGFDRKVQSGYFRIQPGMNGIEIAEKITNPIPDKIRFIILPGWRIEEIAAILPSSGLNINPEEFLNIATNPSSDWLSVGYENLDSLEGFLFPDEYLLDRDISALDIILTFLTRFNEKISSDLLIAFKSQGLNLQQALTMASIVEKEAVINEEMPMIASVFLNRYAIGMKLDSDPTVQYAAGYNVNQATWWTNPLSFQDLNTDSPFNTYVYSGLPPHPICNPGLSSIQAVAFPEETSYYYFRAKCDGSGKHNFAETYEEHLANGCP